MERCLLAVAASRVVVPGLKMRDLVVNRKEAARLRAIKYLLLRSPLVRIRGAFFVYFTPPPKGYQTNRRFFTSQVPTKLNIKKRNPIAQDRKFKKDRDYYAKEASRRLRESPGSKKYF